MSGDEAPRGMAPQRTALAWQRTAIGCGVLGAGALKLGLARGQVVEWVAACWLLALAALLAAIAWRRRRGTAATRRPHGELLAVAAGVAVAAALVVAAVIAAR